MAMGDCAYDPDRLPEGRSAAEELKVVHARRGNTTKSFSMYEPQ
jgi:hypothetical protein